MRRPSQITSSRYGQQNRQHRRGGHAQGETRVELGVEGGIMTFILDYGSSSRFTVKLDQVGPPDPGLAHPRVIAEGGPPLTRYGD